MKNFAFDSTSDWDFLVYWAPLYLPVLAIGIAFALILKIKYSENGPGWPYGLAVVLWLLLYFFVKYIY